MELHVFRRNSERLQTRMSATGSSSAPTSPYLQTARTSLGHDETLSPHPFHSLSTPSQAQAASPCTRRVSGTPTPTPTPAPSPSPSSSSPLTVFSIFSRMHTPLFRPHDDQIIEVDETSGAPTHGRRYSSIVGSPSNVTSPRKGVARRSTGDRETLGRRRSSMQFSVGGTPMSSRLSAKWDHRRPWYWCSLSCDWRPRKSQLRRLCFWLGATGLFMFIFSLVFVLPSDLERLAPVVIGSLLSFISAMTIMVSFLLQPHTRRYPNELLVYVAMCEFGLAVLALIHVMTYCSDTSYNCQALSFRVCGITMALEMFLLLASVGWFGCAILHLFVSVSNPFANYKSQLKCYHFAVWGGSILVSVVVPLIVFSGTFQSRYELSGVEICRAVGLSFPLIPAFSSEEDRERRISQWQTLNMEYWGTFIAVVVLLVIAAQLILAVGWWRSNSGTVIALKARRRMMKRMTTYVHTLNATWLVILVVFFAYRSNPGALHHLAEASMAVSAKLSSSSSSSFDSFSTSTIGVNFLDAFFHYILAAKGYFTCVVWLAVNKHCCAIASPMLCSGGHSRRSSSQYSSDDDSDSDQEVTHDYQQNQAIGHRGTSMNRPPSMTRTPAPSLLFHASHASSSGSATPAVYASQNNETLQREIIYYTVCGITKSILKSAQNADTDVFFQQLMVGADRESALVNIAHSWPADHWSQSPRAYCQGSNMGLTSTMMREGSASSSVHPVGAGPTASFSASHRLTLRDLSLSVVSTDQEPGEREENSESFASNASAAQTRAIAAANAQRFSLYPVSHVPFELFEQEIELQSQRSSEGSLSLSPILANLRRTAQSLYTTNPKTAAASGGRNTSSSIDNPRPKMFIDYAPAEFRAIRRAFGLSDEMYLASFRSTAKERVSAGSSGAFMFFSGDNALIVKSMKEKECRKLVKMIPAYTDYITSNAKSRIIRFFGCHRIRLYGRNFYFVVMSNVLHSNVHTPTITEKYDVKGSWIDRQARLPQVGDMVTCSECNATYEYGRGDASTSFPFHVHRPDTILKDLDMKRPLLLGRRVARELYEQLEMDCEFLNSMGIMDYSLLVGVHKCSRPEQPWQREFMTSLSFLAAGGDLRDSGSDFGDFTLLQGAKRPNCGANLEPLPEDGDFPEEVYFVGIIDILQEWNWEKQLEKVGKTLIGKSSSGISAVAPEAYCERFKARVAQVLRLDEDPGGMKRLVKQPSVHPVATASEGAERLEFEMDEQVALHMSDLEEALRVEAAAVDSDSSSAPSGSGCSAPSN